MHSRTLSSSETAPRHLLLARTALTRAAAMESALATLLAGSSSSFRPGCLAGFLPPLLTLIASFRAHLARSWALGWRRSELASRPARFGVKSVLSGRGAVCSVRARGAHKQLCGAALCRIRSGSVARVPPLYAPYPRSTCCQRCFCFGQLSLTGQIHPANIQPSAPSPAWLHRNGCTWQAARAAQPPAPPPTHTRAYT